MNHLLTAAVAASTILLSAPADAITLLPCEGSNASAQNTMGPDHYRVLEDVDARVIGLDILHPAQGWAMLMVTAWLEDSYDETCGVVALRENEGFSGLYFDTLELRSVSASEFMFTVDVQIPLEPGFGRQTLQIIVNRVNGEIVVRGL